MRQQRLRLTIRRCPKCLGLLEWESKRVRGKKRTPDELVACRDRINCVWVGQFFESMPLTIRNAIAAEPDYYRAYLRIFHHGLNVQLDATKALKDFEVYLQNHPHADPDSRGHQIITEYVRRLSQLKLFTGLVDLLGLSGYRDDLIAREIDYLFPERAERKR